MIELNTGMVNEIISKVGKKSVPIALETLKDVMIRLGMDLNNFHVVQEPGYLLMVFPVSLYNIEVPGTKKDYQKYIGDFTNDPNPREIDRARIIYIWKNTEKWTLKQKEYEQA